ncbi:flagellar basal body-associated FliL family protein [Ferrimonas aestuarii]|uniref:Flagellar protein FliL n=1 Tax=Ferrimonas aestuarii TaxID=2569539 RepID=A0A4U1BRF6_9GAMM|nr:flagellar basal body-associated FliL family protein [Ferrimonas aestuarii]TKB58237.1 flagellar basal body-associated protein FliL [Ferrimonas aestuarii]
MAEESLQVEVNEKTRPKWMLPAIIAAALVLIAVLAAGVVMVLSDDDEASVEQDQVDLTTQVTIGDALYVSLPRPFLFNLPSDKRSYLVQINVQIQVRGIEAQDLVKKHIPLVEDSLLSTFSSADAAKLQSREGKNELRSLALTNVQSILSGVTGKPLVEKILFTGFVMQ